MDKKQATGLVSKRGSLVLTEAGIPACADDDLAAQHLDQHHIGETRSLERLLPATDIVDDSNQSELVSQVSHELSVSCTLQDIPVSPTR